MVGCVKQPAPSHCESDVGAPQIFMCLQDQGCIKGHTKVHASEGDVAALHAGTNAGPAGLAVRRVALPGLRGQPHACKALPELP